MKLKNKIKYDKLAKERIVAYSGIIGKSSIVEMSDGMEDKYFSFDRINGEFNTHKTIEEAKEEAEEALEYYRDAANSEGWPDGLSGSIGFGKLESLCVEKVVANKKDFTDEEWDDAGFNSDFDYVADYSFEEIK